MDIHLHLQNNQKTDPSKKTPSSKEQYCNKPIQSTAEKQYLSQLTETQNIRIRNQIFSLYKNQVLKGKIKVQDIQDLSKVQIVFYHKISSHDVQQSLRIDFNSQYPLEPPKLHLESFSISDLKSSYVMPTFLLLNEMLSKQRWNENIKLSDVLANIYTTIDDFHQSQIQRLDFKNQAEQAIGQYPSIDQMEDRQENLELSKIKKQRRKSSNMTGCADKELTETKNLNRHFRSKLRQVLRDLVASPEDQNEDSKFIDSIFTPNRVGFEDIRKALSNKWFNEGVRRQMNSGQFLHKILRGMMGIKSKKLMIKYYHVMVSAVQQPSSFIRWKYD